MADDRKPYSPGTWSPATGVSTPQVPAIGLSLESSDAIGGDTVLRLGIFIITPELIEQENIKKIEALLTQMSINIGVKLHKVAEGSYSMEFNHLVGYAKHEAFSNDVEKSIRAKFEQSSFRIDNGSWGKFSKKTFIIGSCEVLKTVLEKVEALCKAEFPPSSSPR
jgi:hypothetical protein